MRQAVAIKPLAESETVRYGVLLGMLYEKDDEFPSVVVQLDGKGMICDLFHPSRVCLIERREPNW